MELWLGFLALALMLNLAELAMCNWKGAPEALHLSRQGAAG